MTLEEGFKYRLGTLPPSPLLLSMNEVTASLPETTDLPEFFVASYKWPGWTHGPLDQKNCAASWAFSTASVAADRIAIQSEGRYTANLSPQNLISCCAKNRHGCNSGSIDRAWWYLRKRWYPMHVIHFSRTKMLPITAAPWQVGLMGGENGMPRSPVPTTSRNPTGSINVPLHTESLPMKLR